VVVIKDSLLNPRWRKPEVEVIQNRQFISTQMHALADVSTTQESSSEGTSQVSGTTKVLVSNPLKLEKYNPDKTSFETFMAKVVNVRKFNQWTEVEECAWVRDALEGSAADVLWELGTDVTSTAILETLKERFGNANRTEGYRALLSTRHRQAGETIQVVYIDIRTLLSLASSGSYTDIIFLHADTRPTHKTGSGSILRDIRPITYFPKFQEVYTICSLLL